jgi:hypothetical protein
MKGEKMKGKPEARDKKIPEFRYRIFLPRPKGSFRESTACLTDL